jgi:DNA-binding HxlR family transcriptional regulator
MSSESSTALSQSRNSTPTDRPLFVDPDEIFDGVQDLLGRKWHLRIVYHLLGNGPLGFSALKRDITGISSKMLSESLTRLEADGIVKRTVVSEQPVRVEYSLTESGQALESVVTDVIRWGDEFGVDEETDR